MHACMSLHIYLGPMGISSLRCAYDLALHGEDGDICTVLGP